MQNNLTPFPNNQLEYKIKQLIKNKKDEAIVQQLMYRIDSSSFVKNSIPISDILDPEFLKHKIEDTLERINNGAEDVHQAIETTLRVAETHKNQFVALAPEMQEKLADIKMIYDTFNSLGNTKD
jgi:hypothetical protein